MSNSEFNFVFSQLAVMDIPPRLTCAHARVTRSDEDLPAPHHSASLRQSILGPLPGDAPFPDNPGADGPATPPPTQTSPSTRHTFSHSLSIVAPPQDLPKTIPPPP
ncbi:hypothetical protein C8R41DRAFT_921541 [Lentinula lateritia]|uniref:Uncharacterized protein n=1 Tax=Lentinula lateritia TaxID=40482 RepID=A0ABQ8VCR7_9AGAR|nr:hypothetical protein C8R41DRAFT_921541 [Lentinula lateritia]